MAELAEHPRLKPLHADSSLNAGKLATLDRCSSELLLTSLREGPNRLKTREDGTILEGHHRVYILRQRGVDVDKLPREIVVKETE
jgi:hypothetical protein